MKLGVFLSALVLTAVTSTPPYDYLISLYQWPTVTTLSDGRTMRQVIVYMGNNAFEDAAAQGQMFNAYMRVNNPATQVCTAQDVQASPIPSGKSWGAYAFQLTYPKTTLPLKGKVRVPAIPTTQYVVTAQISPEHPDGDKITSNNYIQQSFTFPAGGTAACVNLPRPQFH